MDPDLKGFLASNSISENDLELLVVPITTSAHFLDKLVPTYDEETFFRHFRVSREVAERVADKFRKSSLFKKDKHGYYGKISAFNQVLIFLWFAGNETSGFRQICDHFNISLSSLHRVINRITYFLSSLTSEVIKWPTDEEKKLSEAYFRNNGFPNVIGAIDKVHIRIAKPDYEVNSYKIKNGHYSMQMQVVCDHNYKIIDLFVGSPGSVQGSQVFKDSPLFQSLQEKCGSYVLLGDKRYPLLKNLMTPFRDSGHLNREQINYNMKLSQNRCFIDDCFRIVKQKFRRLYHIKLRSISLIVHFIKACCVLHNFSLDDNFTSDIEEVRRSMEDESALTFDIKDEECEDELDAMVIREAFVHLLTV
ncbi:putative nuclease HARBI1 [Halyomorpha halys]|uniref:putative nuclease HARBI1 n=1 Tax=Halyomorpha halys TaxID=286706 RepID=UPI0006D5128C|nr:putative nuclease HARBI1 [Halyomorpha halys]